MSLLSHLNVPQREAVLHESGPLLVLAGAGSGKTRVITYRIAHLIKERHVDPRDILAVTFTNKAAEEMRTRVAELIGGGGPSPLVATFHSFCLRLLRRHAPLLGFPTSFSIYDVDDQVALLKTVVKSLDMEGETPRAVQGRLSWAKNHKLGPRAALERAGDHALLGVFDAYQTALKKAGALDFDDLLLHANTLFEKSPELLQRYQGQFQHLLVDEYQDTNHPQYLLIKKLAPPQENLCAVGDDDQSIYRWRGADVANILSFEKDFPNARIIKLEQNYRSTQNILDAAHGVVRTLTGRHDKKLWTDRGKGEQIVYFLGDDESSEASYVVREIDSQMRGGRKLSDFAVLFRTNAQSRPLEEALIRQKIPYQIIGGTRFYDRKEIKDVLAYLQFAVNTADVISMRRTINTPARGVGDVTVNKLAIAAEKNGVTVWEMIAGKLQFVDIAASIKNALSLFKELIAAIAELIAHGDKPSDVLDFVLKESGYLGMLIKEGTEEAHDRIGNIRELIASAKSFEIAFPEAGTAEWLDQVSLVADTDAFDPSTPKATLMTLHCAKGLEFGVVFLAGMEEGLLPHSRNLGEFDLLEEERRLCYVGMTRAKDRLFLTGARVRRTYTGVNACKPSRFLEDVPVAVLAERGAERPTSRPKPQFHSVGANVDNIMKFFKDKDIDVDLGKLAKHAGGGEGNFKKGDNVFMAKYGKGTIMTIEGEGEEKRYVVYFPQIGQRKKLLAKAAKLEKV